MDMGIPDPIISYLDRKAELHIGIPVLLYSRCCQIIFH